jgi:hypothetical protein
MRRAEKLAEAAADASNQAKLAQQELSRVQRQVKRQQVTLQALWQLVRERLNLADAELLRLVTEIEDAEKNSPRVADLCPHCGRSLQENYTKCIYCGEEIKKQNPF